MMVIGTPVISFEILFVPTEMLLLVVQNHCKANPDDRPYPVLDSMLLRS